MTDAFSRILSRPQSSQQGDITETTPSSDAFSRIVGTAAPNGDAVVGPREEPDATGFFAGVRQTIRGKQDPRFAGVRTVFEQFPRELHNPTANAATLGASDDAMGDIVAKTLGAKVIRRERDANGYEVFITRDPDGSEQRGYLNKPGLDSQDVARGVRGSLPYFVAGGAAGTALRGTGAATRIVGQATAAGGTSLGGDVATIPLGSQQSPDLGKAIITAAGAGLGEFLAPAAGALYRHFVAEPRLFNRATGQLTAAGEDAAKAAGYDPAEMTRQIRQEFARAYAKSSGDASASIAAVADDEFRIPSTLGQRTKDAQQLLDEKGMRFGLQGDSAKTIMSAFDQRQLDAVKAATLDGSDEITSIAQRLAPTRVGSELSISELGPHIRSGLQATYQAARGAEKSAWSKVSNITPKAAAFDLLPNSLAGRLGTLPVDSVNTPTAAAMARSIDAFVDGKAISEPVAKVLNQLPVTTLDQMRRRLLAISESAATNTDRKAAQALYAGFNDWIESSAERALLEGDVDTAAAMRIARDTTRTMRSIFSPTGRNGRPTPGARIVNDVLERSDSAEGIVTGLFGGGPAANVPDGTIEALRLMRAGLQRYAQSDVGRQTWNDIRVAYWVRLVRDKTGEAFSPAHMLRNIKLAQNNQASVLKELYKPHERAAMGRLRKALEQITYKDPNPSGSGVALAAYTKQLLGRLLSTVPYAQTAWEFSGVPSAMGRAAAKRAVAGNLAPRNALMGPYAGAASHALQFEGDEDMHRNALLR
jgi:hypothetical protein